MRSVPAETRLRRVWISRWPGLAAGAGTSRLRTLPFSRLWSTCFMQEVPSSCWRLGGRDQEKGAVVREPAADQPPRPDPAGDGEQRTAVALTHLGAQQIGVREHGADVGALEPGAQGARLLHAKGAGARALQVLGEDVRERPPGPPAEQAIARPQHETDHARAVVEHQL